MIVINDTLGTYGGSITLIDRLCRWSVYKKESIKVYCNDASNKEIVSKLKLYGVGIEVFDTCNKKDIKDHIAEDLIASDGNLRIVSFAINNYLSIEQVKYSNNLDFVNVIYSIHPATFYKGTGINNEFLRNIIKKRYRKTIQKMNANGAIIFMDQDNIDSMEKYYNFILDANPIIQPLPMIFNEISDDDLEKKVKMSYDSKTIITACRADFPFKGYLFGLIEDFVILKKSHPEVKLVIVCSGDFDDVQRVKNKISEIPQSVSESIEFHSWMEYQRLLKTISQSYVYIGMGTGVLDAAISYTPSIAVRYNTFDNLADCVIKDRPDYLVAGESCSNPARNILDEILKLSKKDYEILSKECYEFTKAVYDIEGFFDIINSISKKRSYLTNMDSFIHSLNTLLNSMKKEKHYDVNNIEFEKEI